eukprot:Sspe_Gene.56875::Locus_31255_Transcript_1_1_Confidence_1.000_Length_3973::g.56875::m.56875
MHGMYWKCCCWIHLKDTGMHGQVPQEGSVVAASMERDSGEEEREHSLAVEPSQQGTDLLDRGQVSGDIVEKILLIHQRLADRIHRMRDKLDYPTYSDAQYAKECGAHKWVNRHSSGIPFNVLLDLKLLFTVRTGYDQVGFLEDEFIRCFAPVFCPSTDPEKVKIWFMEIDQDANGCIDWDEFSAFLMKGQQGGDQGLRVKAKTYSTKCLEPEFASSSNMLTSINCVTTNNNLGMIYTASTDGTVRMWDSLTLRDKGVVHYGEGSVVHSIHYLPETNRLVVGQFDRTIYIYHCGAKHPGLRQGHRLLQAYKGSSSKSATWDTTIMKTCEYDPDAMMVDSGEAASRNTRTANRIFRNTRHGSNRVLGRQAIDVMLLDELDKSVLSMEPMHSVVTAYSDPFVFGMEEGLVYLYNLAQEEGGVHHGEGLKCLEKWKEHTDWVTHIQAAGQLNGFISSSMDNTVQVLDINKGKSYLRMVEEEDTEKSRGIHYFDYSNEKNLLCTCGISRNATVWNPKARQRMCTLSEHRSALVSVKFLDRCSQLVTLSEDKVLKIWDVRTFRCIQTITDKERRYPEDKYHALGYDSVNDAIITCAGTPVAWRDVDVQAKLETGTSWGAEYEGHLSPIVSCLYNTRFHQIWTADDKFIHSWTLHSGVCLARWSPFSTESKSLPDTTSATTHSHGRITAMCFDRDQRRIITGCDNGAVDMWALDGRKLKYFEYSSPFEVACMMHIVAHEGLAYEQSYLIAAGFGSKCMVWPDQPIPPGLHRVAVGKGAHQLSTHGNYIFSLSFSPPNRLALGTSTGAVILYNLNNMSMLSINKSELGSLGLLNDDSPPSPRKRRGRSAGSQSTSPGNSPTAQSAKRRLLARRILEASKRERGLNGASAFTNFRSAMQMKSLVVVECLVYVTPEVLVTLHGDGDALVWTTKEGHFLEISASFPASYSCGEVALALTVDRVAGLVYVGDGDSMISIFDMADFLKHSAARRSLPRPKTTRRERGRSIAKEAPQDKTTGPSGRVYHNRCGVVLVGCHALRSGAVTQLTLVDPSSPVLIASTGDCSVLILNRFDGTMHTKLGHARESPQSWPSGMPETLSPPRMQHTVAPSAAKPLTYPNHRFTYVFPNDVLPSFAVNDSLQLYHDLFGSSAVLPPLYTNTSQLPPLSAPLPAETEAKQPPRTAPSSDGDDLLETLSTSQAENHLAKLFQKDTRRGLLMDFSLMNHMKITNNRITTEVESQLKKVQQRKRGRQNPTRQFGYTTVRQLQAVRRPLFSPPRVNANCMCSHCRHHRAMGVVSDVCQFHGYSTPPVQVYLPFFFPSFFFLH